MGQGVYIFHLPFLIQQRLSNALDTDKSWEKLAGSLGMNAEVVFRCRAASERNKSPSAELLRIWGAQGHTVEQLFVILCKHRHHRAASVLANFLNDPKCEKRLEKIKPKSDIILRREDIEGADGDRPELSESWTAPGLSWTPLTPSVCSRQSLASGWSQESTSSAGLAALQNTVSVSYEELLHGTGEFSKSQILGKGGYGVVYRAIWKNFTVAVKRILVNSSSDGGQRDQMIKQGRDGICQSLMELRILGRYRHDNILPLFGYSLDGPEPCLIYQYMAGGSLEDRLHPRRENTKQVLNWPERRRIVDGVAKGIDFLHTINTEPFIHGDIKSANILLDQHLEPKIGDFGLCRRGQVEVPDGAPPLIASHIKGTLAYLPPEFIRTKHLSTKLDIYSFGVVLCEVATGMRPYLEKPNPENLVDYLDSQLGEEVGAVDERLADTRPGELDRLIFITCLHLGRLSCRRNPSHRPSIGEILSTLHKADSAAE